MDSKEVRFLMYRAADEEVAVTARIQDKSSKLNQKIMAEPFEGSRPMISRQLKNIFDEAKRNEKVVVAKNAITT